jgi:hypothetical protein
MLNGVSDSTANTAIYQVGYKDKQVLGNYLGPPVIPLSGIRIETG